MAIKIPLTPPTSTLDKLCPHPTERVAAEIIMECGVHTYYKIHTKIAKISTKYYSVAAWPGPEEPPLRIVYIYMYINIMCMFVLIFALVSYKCM